MANATNRWLDKLAEIDKSKGGTGTDYALAKLLGVAAASMSSYRGTRGSQMDDDLATRLADLVDVHPMVIIGEIRAERSRESRTRKMWMQTTDNFRAGFAWAAVIMSAMAFFAFPVPSEASGFVTAERHELYNARIF